LTTTSAPTVMPQSSTTEAEPKPAFPAMGQRAGARARAADGEIGRGGGQRRASQRRIGIVAQSLSPPFNRSKTMAPGTMGTRTGPT
jgi:hypothetical protein